MIMCLKYNLIIVIGITKQHGAQIKCTYKVKNMYYIKLQTCNYVNKNVKLASLQKFKLTYHSK